MRMSLLVSPAKTFQKNVTAAFASVFKNLLTIYWRHCTLFKKQMLQYSDLDTIRHTVQHCFVRDNSIFLSIAKIKCEEIYGLKKKINFEFRLCAVFYESRQV